MLKILKSCIVVFFLSSILLFSLDKATQNRIIGEAYTNCAANDLLERICDEAGGRLAGSIQNEKAISILTEELGKLGITGVIEPFEIKGWIHKEDEVVMLEPTLRKLKVIALGYSEKAPEFAAEAIFVKYCYPDSLKGIDVRGKIIIASQESAPGAEQLLRCESIENASKAGAVAIIFINDKQGMMNLAGTGSFEGAPLPIPAFSVTLEEGKWLERLLKKNIPTKLKIKVLSYCEKFVTKNVIVTFPGKSKNKIVVGAHIDSWDMGQGAIDNGYGTAVIFEIARIIKAVNPEHFYTIEIVWFNAEELGLWGSKYYVDKHKDDTVLAAINLDMPGIPTGFNAMGFDEFIPMFQEMTDNLDGFNLSAGVSNNPWANSDHFPFIEAGIPAFTTNGFLEKDMYWSYHDAGDTYDKANKRFLCDAAAINAVWLLTLATDTSFDFKRYSREQIREMLLKYKLDVRLKKQREWKFD